MNLRQNLLLQLLNDGLLRFLQLREKIVVEESGQFVQPLIINIGQMMNGGLVPFTQFIFVLLMNRSESEFLQQIQLFVGPFR